MREGMRRVLEAVRTWPGLTSRELAERAGLGRHDTAKRLADLYRRRAVDRIEGLDERELRWWLAGAAPGGAAAHPSAVVEHGRAPSAMDFAIARARSGFRSAGRVKPTRDDVLAAAAIERRLQRVYAGELRARLEPDGRVRVEPRA